MPDFIPVDPAPRIHPTAELKSCRLGRHVAIAERVILREVEVGDYSYFERHGEAIYTSIGKFCSIAANTRINALEHPLERVTTHKVTYRPNEYFKHLGVDQEFRERRRGRKVVIGNDVWIGQGAVIRANAVVTKDVAAYEIVAGVPARALRPRFASDIVERLERLCWWDWSDEQLFQAIPDMQNLSIEAFLDRWQR